MLVLAIAVGLACLGFLPFNVRPRRSALVFMGDSGSLVLGFALGSIALLSSWKTAGASLATVLLPVLVLAVPILDALLVTVVRLLEGRPVYAGGRDHTSHRLVYSGLTEKHAVVLLGVLAAAVGGTSLLYSAVDDIKVTLVGVLVTFALLVQFTGALSTLDESENGTRVSFGSALEAQWGRLLEVLGDFVLVTGAFALAYLLRFQGVGTDESRDLFAQALPVLLAARYAVFLLFGLYSSVWRYAGVRDAVRIVLAVVLSEGIAVALLAISDETTFSTFSRSVFVIDAIICIVLIGASRFGPRLLARVVPAITHRGKAHRVLVVGAGRGGRTFARELNETPGEQVVGFVDDDRSLLRRRILGIPVLGTAAELDAVLARVHPDAVAVTISDAPPELLLQLVESCERAGIECTFVRHESTAPVLARAAYE